ncbi:MAG TPA: GNAT family N-acetyltransferase [Cyclobacteriaceae bacterium]|nr:GNAT family N-acetyltransferase [Cyclobacteriaceae bacterium]
MITYRVMNPGDISAGLSLCRAVGWNQVARDWELFLQVNPQGCLVAVRDSGSTSRSGSVERGSTSRGGSVERGSTSRSGSVERSEVVGTVTTVRYDDRFSWIGMVLVDPVMQRQGIGNGLLQHALEILSKEKTVKLDATPAGHEVYQKLDFTDEYAFTRMHLHKIMPDQLPASPALPLQKGDIPEVLEFDRDVFGADRALILEWLREGAPELAFVTRKQGRITGYCFGRHGHNFTQIGPVIAADVNQAIHVATAAMRNAGKGPVIMDILHHTSAWTHTIGNLGFVELRRLTRMYKGSNAWPGLPQKQFAILGPEFG